MKSSLWKKLASVVLALALALSAVGCGSSPGGDSGSQTAETAEQDSGEEPSAVHAEEETEESEAAPSQSVILAYREEAVEGTDPVTAGETCDNLFDHDLTTKWCALREDSHTAYVIWTIQAPVAVEGYLIGTGNDTDCYTGRNPVSWILLGTNADSAPGRDDPGWDVVDVVTGDTFLQPVSQQLFEYKLSKPTQLYNYFMLIIVDEADDEDRLFQISEFALEYEGYNPSFVGSNALNLG